MKKALVRMMLLTVLVVLAGCATLPHPAEMQADITDFVLPKSPEEGKALVYVVRPSAIGTLIRFNVFVDDTVPTSEMGYTRGVQHIYFNLSPGEHEIFSLAENTARIRIKVAAGDIVFLKQNPEFGILYARNSLLMLPDYEGKYHVKRLKLGTIIRQDKQ